MPPREKKEREAKNKQSRHERIQITRYLRQFPYLTDNVIRDVIHKHPGSSDHDDLVRRQELRELHAIEVDLQQGGRPAKAQKNERASDDDDDYDDRDDDNRTLQTQCTAPPPPKKTAVAAAAAAVAKRHLTNGDDDDDGYNGSSSSTAVVRRNIPAAEIAAAVSDDSGARGSMWAVASRTQKARMLAHYADEYEKLTKDDIIDCLTSHFDLVAAERAMDRFAGRKSTTRPHPVSRSSPPSPSTVAQPPDDETMDDNSAGSGWQPTRSKVARERERQCAATSPARASSTAEEEEISFFCSMFPFLPIGIVTVVLRDFSDTDQRIGTLTRETESLQKLEAQFEEQRQKNKPRNHNVVAATAAVAASSPALAAASLPSHHAAVATAARNLERQRATVEHYRAAFPNLTRDEISAVLTRSSDADAALRRVSKQKEQENVDATGGGGGDAANEAAASRNQDHVEGDESASGTVTEQNQCLVCMAAERTHAAIRCGHRIVCHVCAKKLDSVSNRKCLICGSHYIGLFRIYL